MYNFSFNHFYKNKVKTKIEYILLPDSVHNYFKIQNLEEKFKYLFHDKTINLDYNIDL